MTQPPVVRWALAAGLTGLVAALVLLLLLVPSVRGAQEPSADARPVGRRHYALTYNPRSERVVLYGGTPESGPNLDDLWSWDGRRWTLIARTGVREAGHALFVDEVGDLFVAGGLSGSTAKWTGTAWETLLQEPRRGLAAGAYDRRRGRFVLYGGNGGGPGEVLGDTLEFDGTAWARVATGGPPARMMGSMVYDSTREVLVLFGGFVTGPVRQSDDHPLDDLWEWDGVTWRQIEAAGPAARNGAAMAYDAERREIVLFGGLDAGYTMLNDTWLWNGGAWRRAEGDGPPARSDTFMAYDAARRVTVLFGGDADTTVLGDTWEWDGMHWRSIPE